MQTLGLLRQQPHVGINWHDIEHACAIWNKGADAATAGRDASVTVQQRETGLLLARK